MKKDKIENKNISDQLAKSKLKIEILEAQIIKQDDTAVIIDDLKNEIEDLKNRLNKKSEKETFTNKDQEKKMRPSQTDAAISVNLLTNNESTNDLESNQKLDVLNKMKEKARTYAMKEGSLEKEYFSFKSVMIVNDILEKSVRDTIGEKVVGRVYASKAGKSFDNLSDKEKNFLRPDLV